MIVKENKTELGEDIEDMLFTSGRGKVKREKMHRKGGGSKQRQVQCENKWRTQRTFKWRLNRHMDGGQGVDGRKKRS